MTLAKRRYGRKSVGHWAPHFPGNALLKVLLGVSKGGGTVDLLSTDVLCLGTDGLPQTPVLYLCTCAVGRKEFSRLANEARQRGPNPKLGWEKPQFPLKNTFSNEKL